MCYPAHTLTLGGLLLQNLQCSGLRPRVFRKGLYRNPMSVKLLVNAVELLQEADVRVHTAHGNEPLEQLHARVESLPKKNASRASGLRTHLASHAANAAAPQGMGRLSSSRSHAGLVVDAYDGVSSVLSSQLESDCIVTASHRESFQTWRMPILT